MSEPGVVPSRQWAFAACIAFCLKCRWRLEDAAWLFFSWSRKITCAPKEHSGRQYAGFQLWDGGTAAEISPLESAGEQGECQTQCCQAHYLNPEEVKRTNFFHYCYFTYSFRLTWRHLTVPTHLKLWRKRWGNINHVLVFKKSWDHPCFSQTARLHVPSQTSRRIKHLKRSGGGWRTSLKFLEVN